MSSKNKSRNNNRRKENLTKAQRRKLKRQQTKEERSRIRQEEAKSKFYKKISTVFVSAVILTAIIYLVYSSQKFIMPDADDDPIIGNVNAPLTIIEFGDFKCPFTKQFNTGIMKDLLAKYGDRINIVYRDMPTGKHGDARKPAMAAQCADEQGKFKEYHDLLFQNQQLSTINDYKKLASGLGLDREAFDACLDSGKYKSEVKLDFKDGKNAGVIMTPTIFINNVRIDGIVEREIYTNVIEEELSKLSQMKKTL